MGARPDLDAIRARAEAATKGRWEISPEGDGGTQRIETEEIPIARTLGISRPDAAPTDYSRCAANATFIAHARTDVPVLLEEVEALRAALAEAGPHLMHTYGCCSRGFGDESDFCDCGYPEFVARARVALGEPT